MLSDLQLGFRSLRRSPAFALAAIAMLAVGIGGNAAIFSMVNAVLIRPLPGIDTSRLITLARADRGGVRQTISYPDMLDIRAQSKTIESVATFGGRHIGMTVDRVTLREQAVVVSADYFDTLGARPAHGRGFRPEEDRPGTDAAIVISHRLWQRRIAGAPPVGRSVEIGGRAFTIVGVMPEGFLGSYIQHQYDVWIPVGQLHALTPDAADLLLRGTYWMMGVARLREGVALGAAQAELAAISKRLAEAYPDSNRENAIVAHSWSPAGPGGDRVRFFMAIFLAVSGLALLAICANVANLMLAKAAARRREVAIRRAVGATGFRIFRQMLAEGLILAGIAAAAGLLIALWSGDVIATLVPPEGETPLDLRFTIDWRVVMFTLAVAGLSTLVFAAAPAIRLVREQVLAGLRLSGSATPRGNWLRNGLTVAQVALCVVLLTGAALLHRSLTLLRTADPMFETKRLLLAAVDPAANGYSPVRSRQLYERLEDRLSGLPAGQRAALAFVAPFTGTGFGLGGLRPTAEDRPEVFTDQNPVSPSFHRTLGIPLVLGREFSRADTQGAPRVAIFNETLATLLFPAGDPLGKTFRIGELKEAVTLVGIVRDARYRRMNDTSQPMLYLPWRQYEPFPMTIFIRTAGDPLESVAPLRSLISELDPALPLFRVRSMEAQIETSLAGDRMGASLIGSFGLVSSLVAAIGLYALMAFAVERRTREIGIRIALGANRGSVLLASLTQGLRVAGAGIAVGLALSLAGTRVLSSLLYGVSATDPGTFGAVALFLLLTAAAACYIPARRAASVDPMIALRYE